MNAPESVAEKRKMKKWQKIVLIVLLSLLGLLIATAAVIDAVFSHYYNKMNYVPFDSPDETIVYSIDETDETSTGGSDQPSGTTDRQGSEVSAVTTAPLTEDPKIVQEMIDGIDRNVGSDEAPIEIGKQVRNILLIGTDGENADERGRSDSIVLLTINEQTQKITMTSLMPDIFVYIPEVDTYNRINAAYSHGGVSLLRKTVEANFKLPIEQYVSVKFDAFGHIVDLLGGLEIELTQAEIDYLELGNDLKPGLVRLNGAQVLEYCRCSEVPKGDREGDFARTARQREFLAVMSEKMEELSILELPKLLDVFLPFVTTNMEEGKLRALLTSFAEYSDFLLISECLPIDGSWKYAQTDGKRVIGIDFERNIEALRNIVNG